MPCEVANEMRQIFLGTGTGTIGMPPEIGVVDYWGRYADSSLRGDHYGWGF